MKKRCIFLILMLAALILAAVAIAIVPAPAACSDNHDNDSDGKIDYPADPGCLDATDNNETDIIVDTTPPALDTKGAKILRYTVNPTVNVVFKEFITLDNAYLYAVNEETEAMMAIGLNPPSIPITNTTSQDTVNVVPLMNLFNGLYDLVLVVQDVVGNVATVHQKFIIDVPGIDIDIIEPRLGVSDGTASTLVVKTSKRGVPEEAICKITTSAFVYDFDSSALVPFDQLTWSTNHTITDFFSKATFAEYAGFYILCKDKTLNRVNRERFEIYVDTTPPGIASFEFNPAKVVEYPEFEQKLSVILNVTANEPVICRYSINDSKNYDDMTKFPGFDANNAKAYTKNNNSVKVTLADATPASYDFYVQCEDKAGLKSSAVKSTLQVDLAAGLGINVIEPRPYTTNKTITLKMTTVKRALCRIGNTSADYKLMNTDTTGKGHSYYLGQFTDGSYTYAIKCTSQSVGGLFIQEQEMPYTFVVDNTKPSAPNITGSTTTCFGDKFVFVPPITFMATDLESGISGYMYKLDTTNALIQNWTKARGDLNIIDDNYKGEDLNLSQTASYKLSAKAVNGANIEGPESSFIMTYNPQNINCFEKNPPLIVLAKNETEGKTFVEITCTDESGCDNESYYYGLCSSESCEPSTKLEYPFILEVLNAQYLAYNVSDIHGYSATGTEKVEVKEGKTCNNGMKDGNETDIDCGGKCQGCDIGKGCEVNTDCSRNFCSNSTCTEPKCDDKMINGPYGNEETDMDCGGYCGATCEIDKLCRDNGDCAAGFCNPKEKKCKTPACDDKFKNGNETEADCGGDCAADCNDKDGDGIDDSWEEQYCDGNCDPDGDPDGDGLTNIQEFRLKTNPMKKDTDGDGYSDGAEVKAGTDPLDPNSYPRSTAGILLTIIGMLFILGGAGYLLYKRYYAEKLMYIPSAAKMAEKTPQQIVEERRKMEEQQRRIMEQRRKEDEERQRRLEELRGRIGEKRALEERKKKEERESLFGKFGFAAKTAAPRAEARPKAEMPSRIKTESRQEKTEKPAAREEGWISMEKIKNIFRPEPQKPQEGMSKAAEKTPARKEPKEDEDEFRELEEIAEKDMPKKDILEDMKEEFGDKGAEKEEQIYQELEKISEKKKKSKK